jgi:hypothetical protein
MYVSISVRINTSISIGGGGRRRRKTTMVVVVVVEKPLYIFTITVDLSDYNKN